jgi:hypothetical protein
MSAARAGRAGADREPASQLGLPSGREGCSFLVADTNPFNVAAADRVGERIKRVADQCENMLDPICSSTPTKTSATVWDISAYSNRGTVWTGVYFGSIKWQPLRSDQVDRGTRHANAIGGRCIIPSDGMTAGRKRSDSHSDDEKDVGRRRGAAW